MSTYSMVDWQLLYVTYVFHTGNSPGPCGNKQDFHSRSHERAEAQGARYKPMEYLACSILIADSSTRLLLIWPFFTALSTAA